MITQVMWQIRNDKQVSVIIHHRQVAKPPSSCVWSCLTECALRSSQVRFEAERGREGLQRQLAALDGHAHVLAQRLEDAELENHALEHKVWALPCSACFACFA